MYTYAGVLNICYPSRCTNKHVTGLEAVVVELGPRRLSKVLCKPAFQKRSLKMTCCSDFVLLDDTETV